MQRYANWARDDEGRAYPGATVSVFVGGTGALADIFSAGGDRQYPPGQANPITTGSNGFFSFAADDGVYDIQIEMGSSPMATISNIVFLDTVTTIGPDVDFIDFTPQSTTVTFKEGRLYYDGPTHTLTLLNDLSGTSQQIGLETWIRVRNRSGVTINDGEAVYLDGATGKIPTCKKAISTAQKPSEVLGLATITMANQAEGWVTLHGAVNDIDTSALLEGCTVYLSDSVPGGLTCVAPSNAIQVGICTYPHAIHGKIMVRVSDSNTYVDLTSAQTVTGIKKFGSSSHNTSFESDGTMVFSGDAVAWEDLRFPATAINPAGAVGPMGFDTTNIGFTASASGTESIAIVAQMPHTWKEGSSVVPHVHWMPTNTNTGNVLWRMEYKWTNRLEADAVSFTSVDALSAGAGTALTHQTASFGSISGTGKTISSLLTVKISRIGSDASDTYNATALLKEFDIHYQIDTAGSRTEITK